MTTPKEETFALFIAMAIGVWLSWENKLTSQEVQLITYLTGTYFGAQGLKGLINKNGQ